MLINTSHLPVIFNKLKT